MLQPEPQENQQSCNKVNVFKPVYLRIFHFFLSDCCWTQLMQRHLSLFHCRLLWTTSETQNMSVKNPNQSHEISWLSTLYLLLNFSHQRCEKSGRGEGDFPKICVPQWHRKLLLWPNYRCTYDVLYILGVLLIAHLIILKINNGLAVWRDHLPSWFVNSISLVLGHRQEDGEEESQIRKMGNVMNTYDLKKKDLLTSWPNI